MDSTAASLPPLVQTDGRTLVLGGVPAAELARIYGTPLLVLDTEVLDANLARFAALGSELGVDVCYAGKALLVVALARRLAATPLGLDVCSLGELLTAERAGFPPERIVMHGCAKTDAELDAALAGRAGRLVVDNREELERLAARAHPGRPLPILLRLNTGIEAHTHAFVRTGGEDSKFGIPLAEVDAALAAALAAPGLRLAGVHAHIGSQIFEPEPFEASLAVEFEVYARARALGAPLGELIVGGGFGVDPQPGTARFDLAAALARLVARRDLEAARHRIPPPRLGIEPGRSIVAEAGTSLYRVASVKRQGTRKFAIVDGGLTDNPRPLLYGAYHHPELAGRSSLASYEETTLSGRSCENDEIVVAPLPADLRSGDLVALRTTGAYTFSMANNYNRIPRPAVVFAGGGAHAVAVRRESLEEILLDDVDAG
ncbi:MAG: diaminopimelate decarboxylase [Candidatus Baltobacteraceae bacterium]|jgi:diaminopimelate decarboxylase